MDDVQNKNKIHLNPKFVNSNPQVIPKVHFNPAFISNKVSTEHISSISSTEHISNNYNGVLSKHYRLSSTSPSTKHKFTQNFSRISECQPKSVDPSYFNVNGTYKKVNSTHLSSNVSIKTTDTKLNVFKIDRRDQNKNKPNKLLDTTWKSHSKSSTNFVSNLKSNGCVNPLNTNKYINNCLNNNITKPLIVSKTKLIRDNNVKKTKSINFQENNKLSTNKHALQSARSLMLHSPKVNYKQTSLKKVKHSPNNNFKSKYSLCTKNKVIRRKSFEKTDSTLSNGRRDGILKSPMYDPHKKKYSLVSRTKIVRQSSTPIKITRLSPNKYRSFLSPSTTVKSSIQLMARGVKSKYRLQKLRTESSNKTGWKQRKREDTRHSHRYVNIEGSLYKSTKTSLKRQINCSPSQKGLSNVKFSSNKITKKSDKFINIGGVMYKSTKLSLKRHTARPILKTPLISCQNLKSCLKTYRNVSSRYKYSSGSSNVRSPRRSKQSDNFINIGGILYKSTKTTLKKQSAKTPSIDKNIKSKDRQCLIKLRGMQFKISNDGRSLVRARINKGVKTHFNRIHIGGFTYSSTTSGKYVLTKHHSARKIVNSAKQRSLAFLSNNKMNNKQLFSKNNKFCLFYNRFGKCTRKDKGNCPYIHDVNKIAICTRFLRGRCKVTNCLFSHEVDPAKMPVCSHFLRTACTKEKCPYRHVRVNPNAPICSEFLNGHCTKGEACKKQHVLECEDFNTDSGCPRGKSCPLSHRKNMTKRKSLSVSHSTKRQKIRSSRTPISVLGNNNRNLKAKLASDSSRYFQVNSIENAHTSLENNNIDATTSNNLNSNYNYSNESSDFMDKRQRVLAKISKMVSTIQEESNCDTGKYSLISSNSNSEKSIKSTNLAMSSEIVKFHPFDGPLPSYIPLCLSDE